MTLSDSFGKAKAQQEYCTTNGVPMYSPSDGICYYCDKQIYEDIKLEVAESSLITRCPYCHYSFVE